MALALQRGAMALQSHGACSIRLLKECWVAGEIQSHVDVIPSTNIQLYQKCGEGKQPYTDVDTLDTLGPCCTVSTVGYKV